MKKVFSFIKDLMLLSIILASMLFLYRKFQHFFSEDRIPLVDLSWYEYLLFGLFYVGFISFMFMGTGYFLMRFFKIEGLILLVGVICAGAFTIGFQAYIGMLPLDSFAESVRYTIITLFGLVIASVLKKYLPGKETA